jgi:hypothetical protein
MKHLFSTRSLIAVYPGVEVRSSTEWRHNPGIVLDDEQGIRIFLVMRIFGGGEWKIGHYKNIKTSWANILARVPCDLDAHV